MCVAAPTPPSRPAGPPILARTPAAAKRHTTGPMASQENILLTVS